MNVMESSPRSAGGPRPAAVSSHPRPLVAICSQRERSTGKRTPRRLPKAACRRIWLPVACLILGPLLSLTVAGDHDHICRLEAEYPSELGLNLDGDGPRYAPDRVVDVLHIRLDVTPDFEHRTVSGTTTIRFRPIARRVKQIVLDAVDLEIRDIRSDATIADYTNTGSQLIIVFDSAIAPNQESWVEIDHAAEPVRGLYFRTPAMGYPKTDTHVWTQGEAHEARFWFPCFDYPNERSSTEVICHVPQEMTVLSNGRCLGEQAEAEGRKRVHWLQEKPHVNYLICLVAGHFHKLEKQHREIPLGFYTQPSLAHCAENSFRDTADIMAFYEEEIGVPFPWDKYDQVTILDFVAGGMENTTLTTLTANTLFTDETENLRSTRGLDAHEMAHQWFGDLVTCKDWSHLWLNEGFATYYASLYEGHQFGQDALLYDLYRHAQSILPRGQDKRPIVYRNYKNAGEQFDYRAYPKGAWVLHMLRSQLTPELFRRCVQEYLERHALQAVVTDDLRQVLEEQSGRPWDRFFDQWVYHAGHPALKIRYEWQADRKMAKVSIQQTQPIDSDFPLFRLPTHLRFYVNDQVIDQEIVIERRQQDFYCALPGQPNVVRFDPEYTTLAQVDFEKPEAMLLAQLQHPEDMIGRLLATESLARRSNQRTVAALEQALQQDPFYGVRRAASSALQKIHTKEAFDALAASLDQSDARVRLQVVEDLARFYRPETPSILDDLLSTEKNPAIQSAAIRGFGQFHGEVAHRRIAQYLFSDSFRNELAAAAIDAIRQQRAPRYRKPLRQALQQRASVFTARGLSAGLRTLALISRPHRDRIAVRGLLLSYLNHPREALRIGAIRALGELRDPAARANLEALAVKDGPASRVSSAARAALEKLAGGIELCAPRGEFPAKRNHGIKTTARTTSKAIRRMEGATGSSREGRQRSGIFPSADEP